MQLVVRASVALACSLIAGYASAATITLGDVSRGVYSPAGVFASGGSGTAAGNYLAGTFDGTVYHDFFTFDLASLTGLITGAQFQVSTLQGGVGASPATLNLYAYAGSSAALDAGTAGVAGYNALASGIFLASAIIPTTAAPATVTINLNADALAAIQGSEGSLFSIGGSLANPGASDQYLFSLSLGNPATNLVVTNAAATTPEPSSLLLVASAGLGLTGVLRRRLWRQQC